LPAAATREGGGRGGWTGREAAALPRLGEGEKSAGIGIGLLIFICAKPFGALIYMKIRCGNPKKSMNNM
jgi:hypothetical protein